MGFLFFPIWVCRLSGLPELRYELPDLKDKNDFQQMIQPGLRLSPVLALLDHLLRIAVAFSGCNYIIRLPGVFIIRCVLHLEESNI